MKLPAYGKQLLRDRRAGVHPAVVTVVYGEHWDVPNAEFRLAVRPGEALDRDWRCVAGLPVEFLYRCALPINSEALELLGAIARESATILVQTPDSGPMPADELAFISRVLSAGHREWPAWWSDEIENLNGQNRRRWLEEAQGYLARFAA